MPGSGSIQTSIQTPKPLGAGLSKWRAVPGARFRSQDNTKRPKLETLAEKLPSVCARRETEGRVSWPIPRAACSSLCRRLFGRLDASAAANLNIEAIYRRNLRIRYVQ